MVLHLLLWLLLGGSCFLAGHFVLVALRLDEHFPKTYDRFFVSVWLGIAILSPLFLAVSIFTALTPAVGAIVFGGAMGLPLWHKGNVRSLKISLRVIPRTAVAGTALVAFAVAGYTSQIITLTDSGLYHLQAIKWLAEYGAVPGIALIHERLGFSSSWFALTASLDHGSLQGRVYSSLGGFALFTMIHALGINLVRFAGKSAEREDVFLAVACLLSIPPVLFWRMAVSPSPDLPVIVLTIVIAWAYLKAGRQDDAGGQGSIHLLALILGLSAVTIKLSAVPLAFVAACLYCLQGVPRRRNIALAGCASAVFLLPYLAVNTIVSGYPLFPSTMIRLALPWTLDTDSVKSLVTVIQEWARWGGRPTPAGGNDWNWILPWFKGHLYYGLGILVSLAAVAVVALQPGRWSHAGDGEPSVTLRFYGGAIAVALAGMAFSVWKAPDLRLGLGYVVIMPALLVALYAGWQPMAGMPWIHCRLVNMTNFGLAALLGVSLHICCVTLPAYFKLTAAIREGKLLTEGKAGVNWGLPPRVLKFYWQGAGEGGGAYSCERVDYILEDPAGLHYYRPAQEKAYNCWDAPLPCAPEKVADVRLRDARLGLAGGFVRQEAD